MFYHNAEVYAEYTTSNRQSDSVGILSGTPRDATTFPLTGLSRLAHLAPALTWTRFQALAGARSC
jgi:hypothetical protein